MAAHLASQPIGHGNQGAGRWAGDLTHGPKATGHGPGGGRWARRGVGVGRSGLAYGLAQSLGRGYPENVTLLCNAWGNDGDVRKVRGRIPARTGNGDLLLCAVPGGSTSGQSVYTSAGDCLCRLWGYVSGGAGWCALLLSGVQGPGLQETLCRVETACNDAPSVNLSRGDRTVSQIGKVPTMRQLEKAGGDAGLLLDAVERELENAIATTVDSPQQLQAQLLRLQERRVEFFGEDASGG